MFVVRDGPFDLVGGGGGGGGIDFCVFCFLGQSSAIFLLLSHTFPL